jgi:hypothetical protein
VASSDQGLGARKDVSFTTLVSLLAVVVIITISWARFSSTPPFPPKPPLPTFDRGAMARMDRESGLLYKSNLDEDCTLYGVPKITVEGMSKVFPYEQSQVPTKLAPGGPALETGMLRISLSVRPIKRKSRSGTMTSDHLVLKIENKTQSAVAYLVRTTLGGGADVACLSKATLEQNAIALAPGESIERTECFQTSGRSLTVLSVESMQVPPLSFFYLSRLEPMHIGLEARTSAGHVPPKGNTCTTIPQQLITIGMERGTVTWHDVADFYARHRCETYDFPVGYRALTAGQKITLPVTAAQIGKE